MPPLDVLILYNEPALSPDDPDWAQEAGVLESVNAVSGALAAVGHAVRWHGVARVEDLQVVVDRLFRGPAPTWSSTCSKVLAVWAAARRKSRGWWSWPATP